MKVRVGGGGVGGSARKKAGVSSAERKVSTVSVADASVGSSTPL